MSDGCRGQKRTSDPLELELQLVVSCHVGAGVTCRSSGRADSAFYFLFFEIIVKLDHFPLPFSVSNPSHVLTLPPLCSLSNS